MNNELMTAIDLLAKEKNIDKDELLRALSYDRHQYEAGARDKFLKMMKQGYRLLYKARNLSQDTPSLFSCSKCGESCWDTYTWDHSDINYCPHCGAEIEKEDTNEPVT